MERYMIYMPVGTQGRLIPCGRDGSLTLGEMETLVNGCIEALSSSLEPEWAREPVDGIRLVVGEHARLFGAKRNDKATWLYCRQDGDLIVGDAFLCAEVDGNIRRNVRWVYCLKIFLIMRKTDSSDFGIVRSFVKSNATIRTLVLFIHHKHILFYLVYRRKEPTTRR